MPFWKLADLLKEALFGRTDYIGQYGISLSDAQIESLTELTEIASLSESDYRKYQDNRRKAAYSQERADEIKKLTVEYNLLVKEMQDGKMGYDEVGNLRRKYLENVNNKIFELEALQNGSSRQRQTTKDP